MKNKISILFLSSCVLFNWILAQSEIETALSQTDLMIKWDEYSNRSTSTQQIPVENWFKELIEEVGKQYDYNDWSGKSGETKGLVIFRREFFIQNSILLPPSSVSDAIFCSHLTMYQTLRNAELLPITIGVAENCKAAQYGLLGGSLAISSGVKLTVEKELDIGDIALSSGPDSLFSLTFARNNIVVDIRRGKKTRIIRLAAVIDSVIKNAPALDQNNEFNIPALVITPEVTSEFQWKPKNYTKPDDKEME